MTKQAMKYDIYTKEEITERPPRKAVYLESYLASPGAPFVIVCPGGAYEFVSDSNEGKPFAEKLNEAGYNAFVLFYSVGPGNAQNPHPLNDVARAIKFIKDGQMNSRLIKTVLHLWAVLQADTSAVFSRPDTASL